MTSLKETNWAPTRTERLRGAKAGWSTGGNAYDHGVSIVLGGEESSPHGEGRQVNADGEEGGRGPCNA